MRRFLEIFDEYIFNKIFGCDLFVKNPPKSYFLEFFSNNNVQSN